MHQTRIYCLWEMSSLLTSWAAQRNCYSSFWEALLVILQFIVCYHRTPRLGQGHPGTPGLWKECVVLGPWGSAGRCSPGTARAPESQGPQGPTLLSLPVPTWSCGSGVTASPPPAPCLSLTPHPGSLEGRRACPFPRLQPRWAECSPWSCGWSGPPAPPAPWLAPARVHFRDLLSDTQVSRGGVARGLPESQGVCSVCHPAWKAPPVVSVLALHPQHATFVCLDCLQGLAEALPRFLHAVLIYF